MRHHRHPQAHRGDITPNLRVVKPSDTAKLPIPARQNGSGVVVLYVVLMMAAIGLGCWLIGAVS